MQYKIRVDYATVEVSEDSYNEGELDYVNSWTIDSLVGKTFNNVDELIKAINNAEWVFSDNKSDYVYIDSRIDTDATVNVDNEEPSEYEYEAWKRGELMLYNAHLMVGVTMVPTGLEHDMTEEEAESFGLDIG